MLKQDVETDPETVYAKVGKMIPEKSQVDVLDPIGFNNTYALAMTKEDIENMT